MQEISIEMAVAIYVILAPLVIYLWLKPSETIELSKKPEKSPEVPKPTPWITYSFLR